MSCSRVMLITGCGLWMRRVESQRFCLFCACEQCVAIALMQEGRGIPEHLWRPRVQIWFGSHMKQVWQSQPSSVGHISLL